MNNVLDIPWLLVGDFNELELLSDKQGGIPLPCVALNDSLPF